MRHADFEKRQRSIYTSPDLTRTSDGGYLCPKTQRAWTAWCDALEAPIDMLLYCPNCGVQHIDAPFKPVPGDGPEWTNPPHRSHLCASCGCIWRPADVPTNGVEAIATHGTADTWPVPHNEEVVAAVWQSHGTNDTMRHPEQSDLVGGETDCAGGMPCTDCPNKRKCQAGCIRQGDAMWRTPGGIPRFKPCAGQGKFAPPPPPVPLTATALADALDHFWNAAIGASHNELPTVSCIAQGIDAVARELRK